MNVMQAFKQFKTVDRVAGPLMFVKIDQPIGYNELVEITLPDGTEKTGQVLETQEKISVVQVFEGTSGIDTKLTMAHFTGDVAKFPISKEIVGRVFSGLGRPLDGPAIIPEEKIDIVGSAINPYARDKPNEFIQTGISTIDAMNTLVRGQKLPIFSGYGLPHNQLAVQIARQAKLLTGEDFAVVFCAMGITHEDSNFFIRNFERTGALEKSVLFLNLADDPAIERLIAPKMALSAAEYLAYTHDMHILVILTDMTNYCEALRQISAAREEVPGRRGYPGYMYTDLATIYERAGRIKGRKGTVTQMPVLTMPGDDITHPIPDLTGYITEGQIVLSRELHNRGIYPPIDVLPSLSRLWRAGVGEGKTRDDHPGVANQLYAGYAEGKDLRNLVAVIGEEALSPRDKLLLEFADLFEKKFVTQGKDEDRSIFDSLGLSWNLLSTFAPEELKRISVEHIQKYYPKKR